MRLIKPAKLNAGDTVATVSLSCGCAGDKDLVWRYLVGKKRLEQVFGLKVVEMENTLKGSEYIYNHPERRAQDLMSAFADKRIKAIFTCIGGDDSIRMLPYIDFEVIKENPKIFIGYSDTTISHYICLKANLASFYGASVLAELAENHNIYAYTVHWLKKVLFETDPIGMVSPSEEWTGEYLEWSQKNAQISKKMKKNSGYEFLQGKGAACGRLIGGCLEVLEMMKGTLLWPENEIFEGAILFFETSEDMPEPFWLEYWLRNYGIQGILQRVKGIIFGKPYQEKFYEEYKKSIIKILKEFDLEDMPVIYNASFGHSEPMICIPIGAMAEIDCQNKTFKILESGVI